MFPRASFALERKGLLRWIGFPFMPLFWWLELKCGSWGFPRVILFTRAGRLLIPPKHVSACEYHVSYKLALLARVGSTATGQVQLLVRC